VVTWIHDGDSVVVERTDGTEVEIRLLGINAPERDECFFNEARDHLIETLEGHQVSLSVSGTDQFGRTLAYLFDDGRNVNLGLVEDGFAIATTPEGKDLVGQGLITAEARAVSEGRGLWASDSCGTGPIPSVYIARVIANPPGADESNLESETVEIVNSDSQFVDLSGWMLRDESSRHRFTFQSGTGLGAGASIVVATGCPGCIVQIKDSLNRLGVDVEVRHVVELL